MNIKQNYFLLLLLVVFQNINAQVQKLNELSKNKYLGMTVILDESRDDVWGYGVLYQKDKVSKDVVELELIILDKNLNKIGSASYQQNYFNSWLMDLYPEIKYLNLNGNTLHISTGIQGIDASLGALYFKLNLDDFTVTEPKIYFNSLLQSFTGEEMVKKTPIGHTIYPLSNKGYISFNQRDFRVQSGDLYKETSEIVILDLEFNKKWSIVYKKNKKFPVNYYLSAVNDKYLVLYKSIKVSKENFENVYEIYDVQTGKLITTLDLWTDDNYFYSNDRIRLVDDKFISYDFVYEKNKRDERRYDQIIGYSEEEFNLIDLTSSQKILKWDAFKDFFEIDVYGKINNESYIHPMSIQTISNKNKVMVFEGYKPAANTQILDLFAVEFDKDFKILQFYKVKKYMNRWNKVKAYGSYLKINGYFDYAYTEKIDGDTYAFIYTDNEKARDNSSTRKQNWVMGITTFAQGVFATQTLDLNSKDIIISTEVAKNGYILLRETNTKEKTTEIRLEKINY